MTTQTARADAQRPAISAVVLFLAVIALAVAGLALAIKTWGLVALGLAALATVPVIFTVLILITIGK